MGRLSSGAVPPLHDSAQTADLIQERIAVMVVFRRVVIPATALALVLLLSSCTSHPEPASGVNVQSSAAGIGAPASGDVQLSESAGSIDALIKEALNAYAGNDTATLQRILITQKEFDTYLYSEFGKHYPAARDTSTQVREFIWNNHTLSAAKAMRKSLRELGGQEMELVSVNFRDGIKDFGSYKIHEGTNVKVRLKDGDEADMVALGSIVEMNGRYKLLSYRDRE